MPNTSVPQTIATASVSIADQWEVTATHLHTPANPSKCLCGKRLTDMSFHIINRFNDATVGPLGRNCLNKMRTLTHHTITTPTMTIPTTPYTPPPAPAPAPAPAPPPPPPTCRVLHCTNPPTADRRYRFCAQCTLRCMRAGGDTIKMSGTRGTFDSFVRSNPRAVDWMLENHKGWKQNEPTSSYYRLNNYRRAYAANELAFYHPNGYESSYSARDT